MIMLMFAARPRPPFTRLTSLYILLLGAIMALAAANIVMLS